jgi:hypothetical protein
MKFEDSLQQMAMLWIKTAAKKEYPEQANQFNSV